MAINSEKFKEVPVTPCPPEKFSGRQPERQKLIEIARDVAARGRFILLSGNRGAGKSSFINWAEFEIQERVKQFECPVIKKSFYETQGLIYVTFRDLLADISGYQRLGWFAKTLATPNVRKVLDVALKTFNEASKYTGPAAPALGMTAQAVSALLPNPNLSYPELFQTFLEVLKNVSEVLTTEDKFLTLILDEGQWASGIDSQFVKDLIRNLPGRILLIVSFRTDPEFIARYGELLSEVDRYDHAEIRFGKMNAAEIAELARRRFSYELDEKTARFLEETIGDPLCLIRCFNLLHKNQLEPVISNIQSKLQEAVRPERSMYEALPESTKDIVTRLSIMLPPVKLSVIACLMGIENSKLSGLRDQLEHSGVLDAKEKESYDFSHSSLREYIRQQIPEGALIEFHRKAAECVGAVYGKSRLDGKVLLALAEHSFYGGLQELASELNFRLAGQLMERYDFSSAHAMNTRALLAVRASGDVTTLGEILFQRGRILEESFRYDDALEAYGDALKIMKETGSRSGEAATLHQIGMVHQMMNRYEEALGKYEQSLTIERALSNRSGEAASLHQIGRIYEETSRYDEALQKYTESLTIKQARSDRSGEASSLHQIGMVHQKMNRYEEALQKYTESLTIKRALGNRAGEANSLHQIGMVHQMMNRYEEALQKYMESLAIRRALGNRSGESKSLHQIGRVYEETHRHEEALETYMESVALTQALGDRFGEARSLHQIGRVYEELGNLVEAKSYFSQSLAIYSPLGDTRSAEVVRGSLERVEKLLLKK